MTKKPEETDYHEKPFEMLKEQIFMKKYGGANYGQNQSNHREAVA